jgi:cardiolipin synthase
VPSARTIRNAAILGGLGLAAVYAFEAAQYRRTAAKGYQLQDPPTPGTADFARLVEALTIAPLRQGNRVSVLRNGDEIFPAMLAAIQQAKETVNFATYVYWTGSIAPQFADALAERAAAGVEVNVLLDAVGAAKMDHSLIERLRDAGARVAWFRPPKWYTLHKLNNRTHRKILVVDGRVGFTGGVGIAEEWTGNCEDVEHWRDTHVRVEGPVVRDLLSGFVDNWAEATGCILSGRQHLPDVGGFEDGIQAQVTRSTAQKGSTDAEQLFYTAIRRVVTSTPAEAGGRLLASQRASDRARPSAAARARGLRRTSTSRSPATSAAGLATAARAVLRRAGAGAADLASSRAPAVGSARSTIGFLLRQRHVGASLASSPKFHGGNSPRPELHICAWPGETSP